MERIEIGDIVKSQKGRDCLKEFLVCKVENGFAYIVDGKTHKYQNAKKKNVKHLTVVKKASLISVAERINNGETINNKKIKRMISQNLGG